MADKTLTSLTINTILIGLLTFGLLGSYVILVNNEGRGEIFNDYPKIEEFNLNLTNAYDPKGVLLDTANINSNLSADYNPEIAISAADQSGNAISINLQNVATLVWSLLMVMGGLLFGSIFRGVLSAVILAIVGYVTVAYFIKGIRTGQM